MGEPPKPDITMPPPPSIPKSNLPMLYYALVVIGTAALVLALYNLVIIKWCGNTTVLRPHQRGIREAGHTSTRSFFDASSVSSFKYKKDGVTEDEGRNDYECAVCLSVFEEGEEVRQLSKCKHSFHAPCIDMWLYSHMDCPLCRSPVEPLILQRRTATEQTEHSREGLLSPDRDSYDCPENIVSQDS
ncbi:hypothetical protein BUALT_Bualt16G0046000 [Buddleja alternifolia]|uniref:RING-type domain-containing protein n=1 Tax=Buddleja alternifolia TaxID=168488 RepID=A0AAV6WFN7_9LAMI|nr:hypothetical protein BUALT_Bualt16G0046000 [Buddleja alternifolia]